MIWRVFGIMGHKNYIPPALILTFYRLLLIWIILITIRYWKKPSFTIGSLFAIMVFYTIVLLGTNYNNELVTGFKHVAIQGRYIFPVVGIIYALMVYYFASIGNTILRRLTVGSTLLLFLIGCPVLFLTHYSSVFTSWFH
jgi:hypothetical protein